MGSGLLLSIGLAGGFACYGVAFAFVASRQGIRRNFYFYTAMALVLILGATAFGVPYPAIWWAALAVLAAWNAAARGARTDDDHRTGTTGRLTLTVHAAIYVIAAFIASGLMTASLRALAGPPVTQSPLSPQPLVAFVSACLCWVILTRGDTTPQPDYTPVPRAVVAMLVAMAGAAWLATLAVSDATAAGRAATVRTIVLALAAVALAGLGRAPRRREAAWLVYPTLAAGGVKLLVEDFPHSTAATLFVALAMYGAALIAAPRLVQRASGG